MTSILTFEEARQKVAKATGHPCQEWGSGDDDFFFIAWRIEEDEELLLGPSGVYAIGKRSEEIMGFSPAIHSELFQHYENATEMYGDWSMAPEPEPDEKIDWDDISDIDFVLLPE